jgi:hypothetical protein
MCLGLSLFFLPACLWKKSSENNSNLITSSEQNTIENQNVHYSENTTLQKKIETTNNTEEKTENIK